MQFKNVVIQSLAAIEAPIRVSSAEIGEPMPELTVTKSVY